MSETPDWTGNANFQATEQLKSKSTDKPCWDQILIEHEMFTRQLAIDLEKRIQSTIHCTCICQRPQESAAKLNYHSTLQIRRGQVDAQTPNPSASEHI